MTTFAQSSRRRGFVSFEFLTTLLLLLAMSLLFLDVTIRRIRAANALESDRAAVRLAEQVMLSTRTSGFPVVTLPGDVSIKQLPDPAPAAHVWVEVQSKVGNRTAVLVGLVPLKEGT